jgi:small subunit ribosomal protein S7
LTAAKYSVYPPHYVEPVFKKQDIDKLQESGEIENYKLVPFKAARSNDTCSVFHDPLVS